MTLIYVQNKLFAIFFINLSFSTRPCPSLVYHLFHWPQKIRNHTNLPSSLFCLHHCPSWGCVELDVFPLPPWSHQFPPSSLFYPPVPQFCLYPTQCLSPLIPNCASADPDTPLLKSSHIRCSSSSCCNLRPNILTCSGQGKKCSPLMSDLGGMRVIGSSRGCTYLWSGHLCTLICRIIPLVTWCRTCTFHRKTAWIFRSP